MKMAISTGKDAQERELRRFAEKLIKNFRIRSAYADIFLLGGGEMRRIKARYTRKPAHKSVDVLAFPWSNKFPFPEKGKKPLGEIYINRTLARRDPGRAEYLLVHGLLHLLGYTHERKSDTLKMQKQEAKLLGKISND